MRYFVTGAAGFIGSNLIDRLLSLGHDVMGFDNFSTGRIEFLRGALAMPRFQMFQGDLLNPEDLSRAMRGSEFVFHLAANADVRFGTDHPRKDLEQNTIATSNVLEAMRANGVTAIGFSSTGSVYGEPEVFPTPEQAPFPIQTSLYAASKLAAEGLIEAYCEGFGMRAYLFRFVSILGPRYSHGHVFDFCKQLLDHPDHLYVLGNGRQRKSYLFVEDCIDAVLLACAHSGPRVQIYNLGHDGYCEVNDSIAWICERLGVQPRLEYAGGERGWVGDSPFIFLDCSRIRSLGWKPRFSIRQAILETVGFLLKNNWLYGARS